MLIALLGLDWEGGRQYAALYGDGRWACEDPRLRGLLAALADPDTGADPAGGAYGSAAVQRALERFGGRVVWRREAPGPPGRVY